MTSSSCALPAVPLDRLVGRSLPSAKHGAWIVDEIRGSRARLVTADLRGEQTINVDTLRMMLAEIDSSNTDSATAVSVPDSTSPTPKAP